MVGNDRAREKTKEAASNCSRMNTITKSFALIFLVLITCNMAYQLVRLAVSDNGTWKATNQPMKLRNLSIVFFDLATKNQELERRL